MHPTDFEDRPRRRRHDAESADTSAKSWVELDRIAGFAAFDDCAAGRRGEGEKGRKGRTGRENLIFTGFPRALS
jgi:hypothetical protein